MNEQVMTSSLDEWLESRTGRWVEIVLLAALLPNPVASGAVGRPSFGLNPFSSLWLLPLAAWWGYRVWGLRRRGQLRAFMKRVLEVLLLLLAANALMYLLQRLVMWRLGTTGAGASTAGHFSGIGGGLAFGILWITVFYVVGDLSVLALLFLAWRWLERKRQPFSESLRWNLLAMAGWAALAGVIWAAALAVFWFTPLGQLGASDEEQPLMHFHWVRFADGRYGLYGRLSPKLPWGDDPEHGLVVHHTLLDCGPEGNRHPINDCPVMVSDVLAEPDGLVLLRPEDLILRDGQPPQRFWLKTVTRHPGESPGESFNLVDTDRVAPGVKVMGIEPVIRGDRHNSGLKIRLRFNTPVRWDQRLGTWLMSGGEDELFQIPDGKGRTTYLPGMAETMPPLKPRLPATRRLEQMSWHDGEVDFLYSMSPSVLKNLLRQGDRRYGRDIPARLRVTAVAFGAGNNKISVWNRDIHIHLSQEKATP